MRRSNLSDESGVALALAVMIVVIVAVMGAGLLVFVRGDIQATAQANQGQRAFYAADAGVRSASRQLLSDALPQSYDDDGSPTSACDDSNDATSPVSSEWSLENGGRNGDFADAKFLVTIRSVGAGCDAPGTGMKPGLSYFDIVSEGTYRDARRRIEAVYSASEVGAPLAVHAAGDVTLGGSAKVSRGSVFSGDDVTVEPGAVISGSDKTYRDWKKPGYNAASRGTTNASIGAVGDVTGATQYYDSDSNPKFVAASPGTGELTYPFSPTYWQTDSRRGFMREEATSQKTLMDAGAGLDWPKDSTANTVVYVDLSDSAGGVSLTSAECGGSTVCRGTLVVEDGGITLESGASFQGALVTLGDDTSDLSVTVEDGARLDGTISSGGDLTVEGDISVPGRESYLLPGSHGVRLESWRELYE